MAHCKGDPVAKPKAQQVTHGSNHHLLDLRFFDNFSQSMAKILQNHDGCCPGILELMLQLARCVEGIDVDAGVASAKHGRHRDGELRHIGQHDGNACAGLESTAL